MADQYGNMQEFNFRRYLPIIVVVIAFIILASSWRSMTVTIDGGQNGVVFKKFAGGIDKENTLGEGFHFIAPWNSVIIYDVTQQEISEVMNVLSNNGLEIKMDVSIIFRPDVDKLGYLHSEIRENYIKKIVIPFIRASARNVVGRYGPDEMYSTKREAITNEIFMDIDKNLRDKYVILDRVLIRSIELPETIKTAIETKLKQEQETLEYEFRLTKAEKEAQRQILEAEGKAKANAIISASLTDKILREKGIEATLKLANSPNAKTVVIGGSDGMPLILGQ